MPELGEIRHHTEVGKAYGYWRWSACESCGKEKWKASTKSGVSIQADTRICRECNIRNQKRQFGYGKQLKRGAQDVPQQ